ncbi:hypothetical protein [Actinomadura montaniterrae]|uniref:hypothetical protein n=1 Tax=Actinomadura montaniterrae TaxID=1803903 RepID=UPI00178C26B2|nr:hypothetical protein [Actinomadura montaniterrae]
MRSVSESRGDFPPAIWLTSSGLPPITSRIRRTACALRTPSTRTTSLVLDDDAGGAGRLRVREDVAGRLRVGVAVVDVHQHLVWTGPSWAGSPS